jgi:L-methionine (R)-S-oxide reductase
MNVRFGETPTAADWQTALAEILAEFSCGSGTLHRWAEETASLELVAAQGIPADLLPIIQQIPEGKGIAGAAAQRREPVQLCNLQIDASGTARDGAKQTQVQGSITVPVLDGERLCGTLGVGKQVPYEFSEDEIVRLFNHARSIAGLLSPQRGE